MVRGFKNCFVTDLDAHADKPHGRRGLLLWSRPPTPAVAVAGKCAVWARADRSAPSPHHHHIRDWTHQAALVKSEQLLNCMVDLDVCNLHVRKWRCKFLQMVLQYRRLCLSCRFAKRVFSGFKFCLYKACIELTYFKKFPVCIYLFVHQNLRKIRSYTYNVVVLSSHAMQMRPKLRRMVGRCPDAARGVKCSSDHGKGGHEPSSSAESRK